MLDIRYYQTAAGGRPFSDWMERLADLQARAHIQARLARVAIGNPGDVRPVGEGLSELRIDWGPGYRVYLAKAGSDVVLLLAGGDKRTQARDIQRAKGYWKDYKARKTATRRP